MTRLAIRIAAASSCSAIAAILVICAVEAFGIILRENLVLAVIVALAMLDAIERAWATALQAWRDLK